MVLRIDPEVAGIVPPLLKDELDLLEENVIAAGVIYAPLITWDGMILDGHNRFRLIQKYPNLEYTTIELNFANRFEAIAWVCKNQLGRRNLNEQQVKYLTGTRYEAEKASHGGDRDSSRDENGRFTASVQNEHLRSAGKTRKRIAEEQNVSESYVMRAAEFAKGIDIADEIDPGIRQDVLSRKIKPTQEAVAAVAKAEPHKRAALVAMLRTNPDRRSVKPTNQEVKAVADAMTTLQGGDALDGVMAELENALKSMMIRWSFCLRNNLSIFRTEQCRSRIVKLTQIGFDYMKQILKGEIPNED